MKSIVGISFIAIAAFVVVSTGCNQQMANSERSETTETTLASTSDGGCCGNCDSASTAAGKSEGCCGKCANEAAATKAEGCCGKCATETESTIKAEGCCGKCSGESATATKSEQNCENCDAGCVAKTTPQVGCQNGCNACAEGDSANCKCGDVGASKQAAASADAKKAEHVSSMPEDRDIFHYLLENHEKISRKVAELENGVTTVTESTDPVVASKIQEHVASMYVRVENGRPIRMWDKLYQEIFKHADKIEMSIENTENGISVTETSDDEYVVKLIQSHAKVVSGFAKRGFDEAQENHEPPKK